MTNNIKATTILALQLCLMLSFFQFVAPATATSIATITTTENAAKTISNKIAKEWHCPGDGKVSIELKFNLTKKGDVYHLALSKGLENPYAIKAALHAVLFAMPLESSPSIIEDSLITCTISGDKQAPNIEIQVSPSNRKIITDEFKKLPSIEKFTHQTFINGPMAARLDGLCECLYDFPDSPELDDEIEKLIAFVGMDASSAHSWVGIGRWGNKCVEIMRNPSQETLHVLHRSLGAYLKAWTLNHDKNVLYELEDAWTRHAAMEILTASKANPLLLANAALLTNQFKTAKEQYEFAAREGITGASTLLKEMQGPAVDGELKELKLGKQFIPMRNNNDWEPLLHWLPLDTELVLFESSSQNKVQPTPLPFFEGLNVPVTSQFELDLKSKEKPKDPIDVILAKAGAVACLHAARRFSVPKGGFIGLGFSDSVDILILPEAQKATASQVMNELRKSSSNRQAIEGIEVLGFDRAPWSFGLSTLGSKTFACVPYEGVLVAATDLGYLREVLLRLRAQPADRALPASNPEWKFVDTTATVWAVRHFDQAYVPFDSMGMYDIVTVTFIKGESAKAIVDSRGKEIGFTFHYKDSKLSIHHLSSNPETLTGLAQIWPAVFNYNSNPETKKTMYDNPKAVIDKNVLTIVGTVPKLNMIPLQLCLAMGYFVAI